MKQIFCFLALIPLIQGWSKEHVLSMNKENLCKDQFSFEAWLLRHKKVYFSEDELKVRKTNFLLSREQVRNHNNEASSWKMKLNKFSDMSFDEFSSRYLMTAQNCSATNFGHVMSSVAPSETVNWRKRGNYITPVKNQSSCGSCWTFSTTGCMESVTAIHGKHHPLYSLSEQQLVDCAQGFDNHGCEGGLTSHVFEYIRFNNGLMAEQDYPYKAKDGKCHFNPSEAVAFVKVVVNITRGSEDEIWDAVAFKNPVSVAFQVTEDFTKYKSGVFSNPSCGDLPSEVNHAVLVVGYGVDEASGKKYWLTKNSWGIDWGLQRYFKMERGVNMCGVAGCASYPIV